MQRLIQFILSITLGFAVVGIIHDSGTPPRQSTAHTPASDVPQPLQMAYSQAIGQDDSAYHFQANEAGYTATNPAHQLAISVSDDTLTITLDNESWQLSSEMAASDFSLGGNRLTLHRGGYDEWYINGPMGLQQGFTLYEPANIAFTVGGTLPTTANAQSLTIGDALTFSGLMAYDVYEQPVPVEFDLDDNRLVYVYDDIGATYPLMIDPWVQYAKLTASDGTAYDGFGRALALDGDTALVGADEADCSPPPGICGSAYVFVRTGTTWIQQAKLTASDPRSDDMFGRSVALDGDTALVGAFQDDDNGADSGSAYVFVRSGTTWSQQAKLIASDGAFEDRLGYRVALNGDTALVAAPYSDASGLYSGSAYVFVRDGTTWSEQAKLLAVDGTANNYFGISLAVAGDTALVGASGDLRDGYYGSAYVFVRTGTTWSEQAKLLPADGSGNDRFGLAVALAGDTALVGSQFDDDNGDNSGSAYVFVRSGTTWSEEAKLLPSNGIAGDEFGSSVGLDGDAAIIGAPTTVFTGVGSAYVFVRSGTTWSQQAQLTPNDGATDEFGSSVALAGDTALVGAIKYYCFSGPCGSAWVFTRSGTTWNQQAKLLPPYGAAAETDGFGGSVALEGNIAVVGAWGDYDNGFYSGSAYVFGRVGTAWSQKTKLLSSDLTGGDYFGSAVALNGDTILVGASRDDDNGDTSGSAYVFILAQNQTLTTSVACNGPNLEVTIMMGDGPFNITASAGINTPVTDGVLTGITTINGPEKWDNLTVTETTGDLQSMDLGTFKCRSTERPVPVWPAHLSHITSIYPLFSWTAITDANDYRVFVFDDGNPSTRTVDIRQNSGGSTSMQLAVPLPNGRLFWRVRGRQNRVWSLWSIRFTLFIDPPVLFDIPAVQPAIETAPTQVPVPTNHPSSDGSAPPERQLPPTIAAPPPTDLPQPPNPR
ncbi:MAG: FG-GAP repeat protein [Chloroflexi bacterium]|nr:FG-GAP repeat protein [Chloroflexota bacterium]